MSRRYPPCPCPVCGRTFTPGKSSAPGGVQLTCSRACGQNLRARTLNVGSARVYTCEACGSQFSRRVAGRDAARCCSRRCGFDLQRREAVERASFRTPKVCPTYSCRSCGRARRDGERWRSWCSYRCQVDGCGERVNELYRLAAQVGGHGARWRQVLVGYLRERDGGRCGICRRAIRFDLKSGTLGDDRGPSVDHILPRSCGGSDDLANLRLTHWGCNRRRGVGVPGEAVQLALVG